MQNDALPASVAYGSNRRRDGYDTRRQIIPAENRIHQRAFPAAELSHHCEIKTIFRQLVRQILDETFQRFLLRMIRCPVYFAENLRHRVLVPFEFGEDGVPFARGGRLT